MNQESSIAENRQWSFLFFFRGENESHFKVFRRMTWFTVFWIPLFPVGRKFFVTCPVCNYGKKMKKAEAMDILEKKLKKM